MNLFYEKHIHELAEPVAGPVHSGTGPMDGSAVAAALKSDTTIGALFGDDMEGTAGTMRAASSGVAAASPSDAGAAGSASNGGVTRFERDGVLSARQYVCELLCFCVAKHSYRVKYFILRNNILFKVLKLATHEDKCLVLAATRFFRTCIGLKDEFYNRYIIKNRCFEPVRSFPSNDFGSSQIESLPTASAHCKRAWPSSTPYPFPAQVIGQLYANRTRDNLIHSAILELFEFIRRENVKSLVAHLADAYGERLEPLKYVDIFKGLLLRHDQNEEFRRIGVSSSKAPGKDVDGGSMSAACGADGTIVPSLGYVRRAPTTFLGGRRAFPDDDEDAAYFNASDDEGEEEGCEVSVVRTRSLPSNSPEQQPRTYADAGVGASTGSDVGGAGSRVLGCDSTGAVMPSV